MDLPFCVSQIRRVAAAAGVMLQHARWQSSAQCRTGTVNIECAVPDWHRKHHIDDDDNNSIEQSSSYEAGTFLATH
jgi:hypothetical protein